VLAHLKLGEQYENLYQHREKLGWLTTAVNRPEMIEKLAVMLARAPHLFFGRRLLHQCRTFVRHADGSSSATGGAHDDCVLAMAIAQMVRQGGRGSHSRSGTAFLKPFGATEVR